MPGGGWNEWDEEGGGLFKGGSGSGRGGGGAEWGPLADGDLRIKERRRERELRDDRLMSERRGAWCAATGMWAPPGQ